jgi:hypothetical protein
MEKTKLMTKEERECNAMFEHMLKLGKNGLRYFVYHPPGLVFERFGSEIEARAHIEGTPEWVILRADYREDGRPKGLAVIMARTALRRGLETERMDPSARLIHAQDCQSRTRKPTW